MDDELLSQVLERILSREFPSRRILAQSFGMKPSWATRLKREAIARGLLDGKTWDRSFRTPKGQGIRGKDKQKRKLPGLIERKKNPPAWARIERALAGIDPLPPTVEAPSGTHAAALF
jgi:hypothetical protein